MRVATIFTGVGVAAFVGPMTQVAQAQVDHPTNPVRADTTIEGCGAGTSHWVHMGYKVGSIDDWTAYSSCAGFAGRKGWAHILEGFCGGNNTGILYGSNGVADASWHFGHGNYYALWAPSKTWGNTSAISIAGYKSNDACPDFRTVYDDKYK